MTQQPTWSVADPEAADRVEFHLIIIALAANTAHHLREVHGVKPTESKRENARLHMAAHGMPEDARAVGIGRMFGPWTGQRRRRRRGGPAGDHPFKPSSRNALRCECGATREHHRR